MMKIKLTFLFIVLIGTAYCWGADLPEEYVNDLKKMKQVFKKEEMTIDLGYSVFAQTGNLLLEKRSGRYEASGNKYEYSLDDIYIVQNENWNVYMDRSDELIVVKESEALDPAQMMSFDVALEGCESIERKEVGSNYLYTIKFKTPVSKLYSSIQVYCDQREMVPRKIVLNYAYTTEYVKPGGEVMNDKLRFEISYNNIRFSAKKDYNTEHIFSLSQNKLSLSENYLGYRLLDQRFEYRIPQN